MVPELTAQAFSTLIFLTDCSCSCWITGEGFCWGGATSLQAPPVPQRSSPSSKGVSSAARFSVQETVTLNSRDGVYPQSQDSHQFVQFMLGRGSKTDAYKNSDCTRSHVGSQENPCVPWPLTRWVVETTPGGGSEYGGGWIVGSGCQIQNAVRSWDGEDTSATAGDSKEVVAAEKTLWGKWEIIFGLFCGNQQDVTGDGKGETCCC